MLISVLSGVAAFRTSRSGELRIATDNAYVWCEPRIHETWISLGLLAAGALLYVVEISRFIVEFTAQFGGLIGRSILVEGVSYLLYDFNNYIYFAILYSLHPVNPGSMAERQATVPSEFY